METEHLFIIVLHSPLNRHFSYVAQDRIYIVRCVAHAVESRIGAVIHSPFPWSRSTEFTLKGDFVVELRWTTCTSWTVLACSSRCSVLCQGQLLLGTLPKINGISTWLKKKRNASETKAITLLIFCDYLFPKCVVNILSWRIDRKWSENIFDLRRWRNYKYFWWQELWR